MKQRVTKLNAEAVRSRYPIADACDGWFFRLEETSNGAWTIEGIDLWGRTVSRSASDPDAGLAQCVDDACRVNRGTGIR